jgi:Uma2 family endonuclease
LYARSGVPFYWIVDCEARTLEAFELSGDQWMLVAAHDESAVARIPPFSEVELAVGRLFLPGRPSPDEP